MKIQKEKNTYIEVVDDTPLYGLHHMHHFEKGDEIVHELHHCFLFEKKNMKGRKFIISHEKIGSEVYHVVSPHVEGKLYDHANNVYEIKKIQVDDKEFCRITNE